MLRKSFLWLKAPFQHRKWRIRCSRDVYGTIIRVLDLKMATNFILKPFQTLIQQGEKILTLKIRLNKSLVLSSQDQGVKLA